MSHITSEKTIVGEWRKNREFSENDLLPLSRPARNSCDVVEISPDHAHNKTCVSQHCLVCAKKYVPSNEDQRVCPSCKHSALSFGGSRPRYI